MKDNILTKLRDPRFDGVLNRAAADEIERLQEMCRIESMSAAAEDARARHLQAEIGQLRKKRLQDLRQFLEKEYPKIAGAGWLVRFRVRSAIVVFLNRFEAAEAGGTNE